jgi:transposase
MQSFGSSKDPDEIVRLVAQAQTFIDNPKNQGKLFSTVTAETLAIERFATTLSNANVRTIGPELIFGTLFDRIGFNSVPEELFRHLVIARLVYPTSKLKTVDYIYRYRGITTSVSSLYRFLDKLNKDYKQQVETIAYEHTKKILKNTLSVVFYDMTTLYFETEDEDDLRKIGFSKDGKFQCPQIMLGLVVGSGGYPIGYDIFTGNTFEGSTLIPVLEMLQKKYGFGKPIVVADAGLLSKANIENLQTEGYHFIIGARIKNEARETTQKIMENAVGLKDGDSFVIKKKDGTRLIVTYSDKRAKKDVHNRTKGLTKLRAKVATGKLTKTQINNRGYNKFLALSGEIEVTVDETKITDDARWDGLKGYVTSTTLTPRNVVEHYGHLWQIERAFRISKTDLRIRPIYHYKQRRIEAHICVAFVAYTIYKELERLLKESGCDMSPARASELAQTMYELEYIPPSQIFPTKTLLQMDEEQEILYRVVTGCHSPTE